MSQSAQLFVKKKDTEVKFGYYLYLPDEYNKSNEKWPLIIFLHGAGERGNGESELEKVKVHGIPKVLDGERSLPVIAVSPQCSNDSFWVAQIENLNFFVDEIIKEYNVDVSRVYLTGLSMGGFGAWYYAMAYPQKFAAIAPICGGGMSWNAAVLKDIPVWAFHGEKDTVVPFSQSVEMIEALKKCGGIVKFTSYPELQHNSWTETYNNDELYEWLLKQHK